LLYGLPAAVLIVGLLIPMALTTFAALDGDIPIAGNFIDVLSDLDALSAAWHSVLWVGIALVVVAAGYVIAVLSQVMRWRAPLYFMVLPFGVSALVSGAVFRMIFDPVPERGTVNALSGGSTVWLGPEFIWLVLALAFAWTWLGFVVVLFRKGFQETGHSGFLTEGGRFVLPKPGPVAAIVVLTVLVAAIRVFDLVLITAPGSVQDDVDVVGLHWWRMTLRSSDTGRPAALAVLLYVFVAVVTVFGLRSARRLEPAVRRSPPAVAPRQRTRRPWPSWIIGLLTSAAWLFPIVVLLGTALHDPVAAGSAGWWRGDGLGLGSFAAIREAAAVTALFGNVLLACLATALVVATAVPAAYLLTWGALPGWLSRSATTLLLILAVAPVQMYLGPLRDMFSRLGWVGSPALLALVHAMAGLPFAILVVRTAFLAAPPDLSGKLPAMDAMWRRGRYRPALIAVAVMEFILVWNDFIVGFLIADAGPTPLTLLLWGEARQFGTSTGTIAANAILSAVVPVALLLMTWPRVVAGLTGGVAR